MPRVGCRVVVLRFGGVCCVVLWFWFVVGCCFCPWCCCLVSSGRVPVFVAVCCGFVVLAFAGCSSVLSSLASSGVFCLVACWSVFASCWVFALVVFALSGCLRAWCCWWSSSVCFCLSCSVGSLRSWLRLLPAFVVGGFFLCGLNLRGKHDYKTFKAKCDVGGDVVAVKPPQTPPVGDSPPVRVRLPLFRHFTSGKKIFWRRYPKGHLHQKTLVPFGILQAVQRAIRDIFFKKVKHVNPFLKKR